MPFYLRPGTTGDTLILVPGLGCDKEWFASAFRHEGLAGAALVSFDFPNQGMLAPIGASSSLWAGGLAFLSQWVEAVCLLATETGDRFHMVAHSMGNVPALTAWASIPQKRRGSFIAIEGNLAEDDCFASSRMAQSVHETESFIEELRASGDSALKRWGDDLMWCDPDYLNHLGRDLTAICSTGELIDRWSTLEHPHYLYGQRSGYPEHHRNLFERTGTAVWEIPASGHFPMYTNAKATWDAVAGAVRSAHA